MLLVFALEGGVSDLAGRGGEGRDCEDWDWDGDGMEVDGDGDGDVRRAAGVGGAQPRGGLVMRWIVRVDYFKDVSRND